MQERPLDGAGHRPVKLDIANMSFDAMTGPLLGLERALKDKNVVFSRLVIRHVREYLNM
tara:strand:- start:846 stop:1022 length:177 start_codon:yes stop_codon:yes gene_type:complete